MIGILLLLVFLIMAVAHPLLMRTIWNRNVYDPVVGYDMEIFPHPAPPSARHLLGTDTLGRDVLSILLACTPQTLGMAIAAAISSALIGTAVGLLSAYFRGLIDWLFSHIADVCLLAPAPLVMVIIGFTFNIQPLQFGLIYGVLSGLGAVGIVMRSHALLLVTKPFIDASRVAGAGARRILFHHMLPHMLPLAAVNMLLTVTGAVFANGFIAFMGLSRAQLNWGTMIFDSFTYQSVNATITWNVLVPAALAISLFAASFYMIGRGLQGVVEPRLRTLRI
jgi:peptide/nickel transport system permease protein